MLRQPPPFEEILGDLRRELCQPILCDAFAPFSYTDLRLRDSNAFRGAKSIRSLTGSCSSFYLFCFLLVVPPRPPPPPDHDQYRRYTNLSVNIAEWKKQDRPITIPLSSIIQLRSVPHMPYVAHKRLVTIVHTPVHNVYYAGAMIPIRVHARVRPSVLAAELNRIRYLPRPSTQSYTEKFLNSRDNIYFDDEAREIRARVDSLLRRVHVFIPRAAASDFAEEIVPERMRSGDYVRRLLSGRNNAKKDAEAASWYEIPERGSFGNLACVKYVAGKPQSVRKPYYKVADLRPSDIRNDVNLLSYYSKNRQAAATACKGWRDRVPELYEDPAKAKKKEEETIEEAAEE
ncbi:hypothetical protein KM043_001937 [Ampulex compressa]|nr:hypothetical protein KM043_001937 [Ampulex compressa]